MQYEDNGWTYDDRTEYDEGVRGGGEEEEEETREQSD